MDIPLVLQAPIHVCSYRVLYGDTDSGGVMYYGTYYRLFEIGRTEYMRSVLRLPYRDFEQKGIIFPVSEAYCRYKAPAHYDEMLEIRSCLADHSPVWLRFHYEIVRSHDGRLVARGFTVHPAIDGAGRLTRLPQEVRTAANACAIGD